ncbi:hypothetical protein RI367_000336 [Sorochytrium milnesiophthora]
MSLYQIATIPPEDLHDDTLYPEVYYEETRDPLLTERDHYFLTYSFGLETAHRNNIVHLTSNVVAYVVGNVVVMYNTASGDQHYVCGIRGGGLSAIAVHPSLHYFAFAERHPDGPNVYVFTYPELRLYRVLRKGAARSFAHLSFSANGDRLATVGGDPDYMLTLWNWRKEQVILRSKAFSQDVYNVAFSPTSDTALTTSGMGHIKFWKMSATFTGLKLQGMVGKFGASELSDIAAFTELPDGKTLSTTETGIMLLWDGGSIKCEITGKHGRKCHQGPIHVCMIEDREVITGGEDGYIRLWDLDRIQTIDDESNVSGQEPDDDSRPSTGDAEHSESGQASGDNATTNTTEAAKQASAPPVKSSIAAVVHELDPLDEIHVGKDVKILSISRVPGSQSEYILQDMRGGLWCTLDTTGCALLATFQDGTIRFLRHGLYTPKRLSIEFTLTHVFKPHAQPITDFSVSKTGELLITAAQDKTLFLFAIEPPSTGPGNVAVFDQSCPVVPLGFLATNERILRLSWCYENHEKPGGGKNKHKLLVVTDEGFLYVVDISAPLRVIRTLSKPNAASVNSYELPTAEVTWTPWRLENFVLPHLKPVQKLGDADAVENGGAANTAGDQTKTDARPTSPNTTGRPTSPSRSPAEEASGSNATAPAAAAAAANKSKDGSGKPEAASKPLLMVHDKPFSVFHLSRSSAFLMAGTEDGYILCRPWSAERLLNLDTVIGHELVMKPTPEDQFWKVSAHNARVADISLTFDDALLCSAGEDGGVFAWKSVTEDLKKPAASVVGGSASTNDMVVADITDATAYTIQEARLLTERDREAKKSNDEKQQTLVAVTALQQEYRKLLHDNSSAPEHEQLPRERFHIDQGLKQRIDRQTELRLEQQRNELMWYIERETLALQKLERRFLNDIATEILKVQAFTTNHCVMTFRTPKLAHKLRLLGLADSSLDPNDSLGKAGAASDKQKSSSANSASGGKGEGVKTTQEARKTVRAERAVQLSELMARKPSDDYENADDVAIIRYAEDNMGDYKLKTDKNYIVPASERVNAEKKHKQIMLLKESMFTLMEQVNQKVFLLRDQKMAVAAMVKERVAQAMELNTLLQDKAVMSEIDRIKRFTEDHLVDPRDRYNVDDATVEQMRQASSAEADARRHQGVDGDFQQSAEPVEHALAETEGPTALVADAERTVSVPGTARAASPIQPSRLEETEDEIRKRVARRQLYYIIKDVDSAVRAFEDKLKKVLRERVMVAGDIKFAEMKLIILYEEWLLLKEFEKYDNALAEKLNVKRSEKADIDVKIQDIQLRLSEKKTEIEEVISRLAAVQAKFSALIGDNNKFEEILSKQFKRKVKRSKKRDKRNANAGDSDDANAAIEEEEEEESDDDSDYNSASGDSDNDDTELTDDCPAGCSEELHAEVLKLREKRLDEEDVVSDIQKAAEVLKKEHESLSKKEKVIDGALRQAEMEIQEFQTQKQQKLNELDVVIPLCLHQIRFLEEECIPTDLSQALVFVSDMLVRLKHRIGELQEEKLSIRKQHRELRKMHVDLLRSKKEKHKALLNLEERSREVQMLKFGKLIDLESLEKVGVNKTADELRDRLQHEDTRRAKELAQRKKKLSDIKHEMTLAVVDNTERLEQVIALTEQLKQTESKLNASQGSVSAEYSSLDQEDEREKEQLLQLVQSQAHEIELLQAEIHQLTRKAGGAHV